MKLLVTGGAGYVGSVCSAVLVEQGHEIPAEIAPRRAGDPATLIASSDKIKRELDWNPQRTDLETIVTDAWNFTRQLGDRAHSARR